MFAVIRPEIGLTNIYTIYDLRVPNNTPNFAITFYRKS
jgi:hypothetical protein